MNRPTPGATTILAELQISNQPDKAVVDASRVRGGPLEVADMAALHAIPVDLRRANVTRVYVVSLDRYYVLRGGIANQHWLLEAAPTDPSGGTGTALRLNRFLPDLLVQVGQAVNYAFPSDLVGPGTHAIDSVAGVGLPDGLTVGNSGFSGTIAAAGAGMAALNITFVSGHRLQYVFGWKATATPVAHTLGIVKVDVVYPQVDDPNNPIVAYDHDVRLVLNQAGLAEDQQTCKPGLTNRFIGSNTVADCLAIAAKGKMNQNSQAFYRFAMSVRNLRLAYPNQAAVRFDLYANRKAGNPASVAKNVLLYRLGKDATSGLVADAGTIGFTSQNPVDLGVIDINNNNFGYPVDVTERLMARIDIDLINGTATLTPEVPSVVQPFIVGGPYSLTITTPDVQPHIVGGPYSLTITTP
jgi:hypothetical protein